MATSLVDFQTGWETTRKLDALKSSGASAEAVATAEKEARRHLIVPLHEDLADVGVIRETDEKGMDQEYLDRLRFTLKDETTGRIKVFGDDWALVFYVMDLAGVRNLIPVAK